MSGSGGVACANGGPGGTSQFMIGGYCCQSLRGDQEYTLERWAALKHQIARCAMIQEEREQSIEKAARAQDSSGLYTLDGQHTRMSGGIKDVRYLYIHV